MTFGIAIRPRDIGSKIAMCGGKKSYSGFRAYRAAQKMNRNWDTKPKVTPYRCAMCGKYHLGGKSL